MTALQLKFCATGLLLTAVAFVIYPRVSKQSEIERNPGQTHSREASVPRRDSPREVNQEVSNGKPPNRAESSSANKTSPARNTAPSPKTNENRIQATPTPGLGPGLCQNPGIGQKLQHAVASRKSPQNKRPPPVAVQLAADAQLPAAMMAKAQWTSSSSQPQTPQETAAIEEIMNDFYKELSSLLTEAGVSGDSSENGETQIVREGPILQQARNNADLRFRTLYGDEAYNRYLMRSNLEAHLSK